jgi:hypothetical protein
MLPDATPTAVLQDRLSAALAARSPSAKLHKAPAERLGRYAHEVAFRGADAEVGDLAIEGWVAETADERTVRCYLVAQVRIEEADAWFPSLLVAAARWRSYLGPDEQADITMLLVASGGIVAPGRVSVLERNEAFAQVHVWAPGPNSAKWPVEADLFVRRLRLGPIEGPQGTAGGDLSPADAVFEGISSDVRERWQRVLMEQGIKDVERARRLLAAVEE